MTAPAPSNPAQSDPAQSDPAQSNPAQSNPAQSNPAHDNAPPASPAPRRPLPRFPEPDTEPFWRATREHRLLYEVSAATGDILFYPRRQPVVSGDHDPSWRESAGIGTIYTFTVIRQHGHPYFRGHAPYVVAFVDLDEGLRMLSEVVADPASVRIGQRVRVDWEDHDEVSIPIFRPVDAE